VTTEIVLNILEWFYQFRYLGTTPTNQYTNQEEIKGRLKTENACYHSVQNIFSSSFLSKNTAIQLHRTVIWLLFLWEWNLVPRT